MEVRKTATTKAAPGSSTWMAGFFLLGILLGMVGSLVITWQYHIDVEPESIGLHFLAMTAGYVVASLLTPRLFSNVPVRTVGMCASALAFLSLVGLAVFAPPSAPVWRISTLAVAGLSAGALTYTLFYANQALFEMAPASYANRAGALFVGGGLLATMIVRDHLLRRFHQNSDKPAFACTGHLPAGPGFQSSACSHQPPTTTAG